MTFHIRSLVVAEGVNYKRFTPHYLESDPPKLTPLKKHNSEHFHTFQLLKSNLGWSGFTDRGRAGSCFCLVVLVFEVHREHVVEGAVEALAVLEDLDVLEDSRSSHVP